MTKPIKVVFTGAQGVGKDTSLFGVAHELKMREIAEFAITNE